MTQSVIVFDAFGTLVKIGRRLSPYRSLMTWMRENGRRPSPNDAEFIMSSPLDLAGIAAAFNMEPPIASLQRWEGELRIELGTIKLYPDTLPVIDDLRRKGYRIGLCSNLASPYGAPIKALLPVLNAYALSYEVSAVKPDPAIYQHLLDQLRCAAGDVVFVGDTPSADFDGPIAFGMAARLINRNAGQTLTDAIEGLPFLGKR